MLIVYIFILVLFSSTIYKFSEIINISSNNQSNKILFLHTFFEPIIRCFNVFKFKEYNEKYGV